jgi:hypothetical protein
VAEAEGRLADAADGYHDAAARWAAYGSVIEQAHALTGAGRSLIGLGRGQDAVEPLRVARDLFSVPAATVLVGEVDELLAKATARAS